VDITKSKIHCSKNWLSSHQKNRGVNQPLFSKALGKYKRLLVSKKKGSSDYGPAFGFSPEWNQPWQIWNGE